MTRTQERQSRLDEAGEHYAQGRRRQAQQLLAALAAEDATDQEAVFGLGVTTYELGDHVAARPLFERALTLDGARAGQAREYLQLFDRSRDDYEAARRMFDEGDAAGAAVKLEQVVQNAPYLVAPRFAAGVCWKRLGQDEKARGHFERVLELDPGHAGAAAALHGATQSEGSGELRGVVGHVDPRLPWQSLLNRQGYGFRLERADGEIDQVYILGAFLTGGGVRDGDTVVIRRGRRTSQGDVRAKAIYNERTRSLIRAWFWIPAILPVVLVLGLFVAFMVFVVLAGPDASNLPDLGPPDFPSVQPPDFPARPELPPLPSVEAP